MQFTRPSLFAKVGLICETIDRDKERDGKQREIACEEDEHQEAESVLPVLGTIKARPRSAVRASNHAQYAVNRKYGVA